MAIAKVLQEYGHPELSLGESTTVCTEMFRLFGGSHGPALQDRTAFQEYLSSRHYRRPTHAHRAPAISCSIQVYHARMFRELLGNYSRWQFHHPGPVFFYLFAAGEYLFCDVLRIVPAPLNAQLLTIVLVNTALLFGSIEIFARHFQGTLFRPLAVTAAVRIAIQPQRNTG
jgi:hypothetical protein